MAAYESSSWGTIVQQVARELDLAVIIPAAFFTAATATSVTVANFYANTNMGGADLINRNVVLFRGGAATSADYARPAGSFVNTTGVISTAGGGNYADTTTTSEILELWWDGIRRDQEVIDAANRVLKKINFSTFVPISHLGDLDGDMAKSTDTDWTDVGTPTTSAKSTTAKRTPFGLRSYELVGDAVNEGTRSATISITKNLSVRVMAISSCASGTASLQPYSITGSAVFGTALTHSESEPQLMLGQWEQAPATCTDFAANLLGSTNPSDIYWNALWEYKQGVTLVNLPTYVSERYKVPAIFRCHPTLANPNSTNCYPAEALDMVELVEGQDYRLMFHQQDANPYAVNMSAEYMARYGFDYPLAIQVRRPWYDVGSFSSDTSTTQAPLLELIPRLKLELIDTIYAPRFPNDPKWAALRANAASEWAIASMARPVRSVAKAQPYFSMNGSWI